MPKRKVSRPANRSGSRDGSRSTTSAKHSTLDRLDRYATHHSVRKATKKYTAIPTDHHSLVKGEFALGLVIIIMSPVITNKTGGMVAVFPSGEKHSAGHASPDTEHWAKRLVAWSLIYAVLLPMSYGKKWGGVAAGLSSLLILTLIMMPTGDGMYIEKFLNWITNAFQAHAPAPPPPSNLPPLGSQVKPPPPGWNPQPGSFNQPPGGGIPFSV